MIRYSLGTYVVLLCMFIIVSPSTVYGQEQSLNGQTYQQFLATLPDGLHARPAGHTISVPFDRLTMAAIALEKTQAWEAESGMGVTAFLKDAPDGRRLQGLRQLLGGDTGGLTQVYSLGQPDPRSVMTAANLVRAHGFPLAADCLCVVSPDMPGKRVKAWVSIPMEKRTPVDTLMDELLTPPNKRMLFEQARNFYITPPADVTIDPQRFLALAIQLDSSGRFYSYDTLLTLARPTDLTTQFRIAQYLWSWGRYEQADAHFTSAMARVPSPEVRSVRLAYLEYLQWLHKAGKTLPTGERLETLPRHQDALLAADALLVAGKFDEATAQYKAVLSDTRAPLERRMDAWCGLLDSEPGLALRGTIHLMHGGIVRLEDQTRREQLTRIMGWQLWRVASTELPQETNPYASQPLEPAPPPHKPLRDVPNWEAEIGKLAKYLLYFEMLLLLPDPDHHQENQRLPLALMLAIGKETDRAAEVLYKRQMHQIVAPRGGWRTPDGSQLPDPYQHRIYSYPRPQEFQSLTRDFLQTLQQRPDAATLLPTLWAPLVRQYTAHATAETDDAATKVSMQALCEITKNMGHVLNPMPAIWNPGEPLPAGDPVDMTRVAPVSAALRDAFAEDTIARATSTYLRDGIIATMRAVRDPQLLDELLAISFVAMDRYRQVSNDAAQTAALANYAAMQLEMDVYRPHLKPYGTRFRERYAPADK